MPTPDRPARPTSRRGLASCDAFGPAAFPRLLAVAQRRLGTGPERATPLALRVLTRGVASLADVLGALGLPSPPR